MRLVELEGERGQIQKGAHALHRVSGRVCPLVKVEEQDLAWWVHLEPLLEVACVPALADEGVDVAAVALHLLSVLVHHRVRAIRLAATLHRACHILDQSSKGWRLVGELLVHLVVDALVQVAHDCTIHSLVQILRVRARDRVPQREKKADARDVLEDVHRAGEAVEVAGRRLARHLEVIR